MNWVGYRAGGKKSSLCEKNHNFFVTKATDLIIIFLKNGRRNMCHTLIFVFEKKITFFSMIYFNDLL